MNKAAQNNKITLEGELAPELLIVWAVRGQPSKSGEGRLQVERALCQVAVRHACTAVSTGSAAGNGGRNNARTHDAAASIGAFCTQKTGSYFK